MRKSVDDRPDHRFSLSPLLSALSRAIAGLAAAKPNTTSANQPAPPDARLHCELLEPRLLLSSDTLPLPGVIGVPGEVRSAESTTGETTPVGGFSAQSATFNDFALVRYNGDGSLDTSFSGGGKVTTDIGHYWDQAYGMAMQSDGKIVLAGIVTGTSTSNSDFALVRYRSDGSLDTSFDGDGKVVSSAGYVRESLQSITRMAVWIPRSATAGCFATRRSTSAAWQASVFLRICLSILMSATS